LSTPIYRNPQHHYYKQLNAKTALHHRQLFTTFVCSIYIEQFGQGGCTWGVDLSYLQGFDVMTYRITQATSQELKALDQAITDFNITVVPELPRAELHSGYLGFSSRGVLFKKGLRAPRGSEKLLAWPHKNISPKKNMTKPRRIALYADGIRSFLRKKNFKLH
jgi:hypothetical protein